MTYSQFDEKKKFHTTLSILCAAITYYVYHKKTPSNMQKRRWSTKTFMNVVSQFFIIAHTRFAWFSNKKKLKMRTFGLMSIQNSKIKRDIKPNFAERGKGFSGRILSQNRIERQLFSLCIGPIKKRQFDIQYVNPFNFVLFLRFFARIQREKNIT